MPAVEPVAIEGELGIGVVSVTTTRSRDEDAPGDRAVERIEAAGYTVPIRELINDDYDEIQRLITRFVNRKDIHAVVLNGGFGLHDRDVTVEAMRQLIAKRLPGVEEAIRAQLRQTDETLALVDRSVCGVRAGVVVCGVPADATVVEAALDDVLLPELSYLVGLARVGREGEHADSG